MEFTAEVIAAAMGGEVVGDKNAAVNLFAKIEEGKKGAISFLSNPKYEHYIYDTESSIVIVSKDFAPQKAVKATMIKVDDPYKSFADLLNLYVANKPYPKGVSERAVIDPSVSLGEGAYVGDYTVIEKGSKIGRNPRIYPQVWIGPNVKIGDDVILYPGVKIYEDCVIGDRVTVHAGTVIGSDGFGFAPTGDTYTKIPQIGNVVIENDVEIGANGAIDRATMGSTYIRNGVKFDNLVHIAHNVEIGENTVAAAQFGIAGSSKVGKNCMIAGQCGISGHATLGERSVLGSRTALSSTDMPTGTYLGFPAMDAAQFKRSFIVTKSLPEMRTKLLTLEKEVARLKEKIENGK